MGECAQPNNGWGAKTSPKPFLQVCYDAPRPLHVLTPQPLRTHRLRHKLAHTDSHLLPAPPLPHSPLPATGIIFLLVWNLTYPPMQQLRALRSSVTHRMHPPAHKYFLEDHLGGGHEDDTAAAALAPGQAGNASRPSTLSTLVWTQPVWEAQLPGVDRSWAAVRVLGGGAAEGYRVNGVAPVDRSPRCVKSGICEDRQQAGQGGQGVQGAKDQRQEKGKEQEGQGQEGQQEQGQLEGQQQQQQRPGIQQKKQHQATDSDTGASDGSDQSAAPGRCGYKGLACVVSAKDRRDLVVEAARWTWRGYRWGRVGRCGEV